jgi:hypothetical protein
MRRTVSTGYGSTSRSALPGSAPRRLRTAADRTPSWKIAGTIQVLIEGADALALTVPIQTIDRPGERIEEVGLQTVEAKSILGGAQQAVVRHQLAEYLAIPDAPIQKAFVSFFHPPVNCQPYILRHCITLKSAKNHFLQTFSSNRKPFFGRRGDRPASTPRIASVRESLSPSPVSSSLAALQSEAVPCGVLRLGPHYANTPATT